MDLKHASTQSLEKQLDEICKVLETRFDEDELWEQKHDIEEELQKRGER